MYVCVCVGVCMFAGTFVIWAKIEMCTCCSSSSRGRCCGGVVETPAELECFWSLLKNVCREEPACPWRLVLICFPWLTCVQVMASLPDSPGTFFKASFLEVVFKIASHWTTCKLATYRRPSGSSLIKTNCGEVSSPAGHMIRVGRSGVIYEPICVNTVNIQHIRYSYGQTVEHPPHGIPRSLIFHTGSCNRFNVYIWTWEDVMSLPRSLSDSQMSHVRMDRCLYCTGSSLRHLSHTFSGNFILWTGWDETSS